ncbi:MAG: response regulator [Bacteroidales bacterium]|nr:response regulator [Bacteroidales bacterium]
MNKNITVLIADDDFDYLFQMRFRLESAGFDVISASSQKEAEQLIEIGGFDAAVFDLMMENDDSGFVLAYKTKKAFPSIPVVLSTAVTAETGYNFENDSSWVKADLYLEKGVESERIAEELNKLLKM